MNGTYDDMIDMPHPISKKHPRMSLYNRAFQFAPFAALTGFEDSIAETKRLTSKHIGTEEEQSQNFLL